MINRSFRFRIHRLPTLRNALAIGVAVAACLTAFGSASAAMSPAEQAVIAFDKAGDKPVKHYRIGFLSECVQNPYCQAALKGVKDASTKFGFDFKLYDANFSSAEQLKQVQNAATEKFDGYLFGPAAAAPACSMWQQFLKPTGVPTVTIDLPMCTDADYTPGLGGTVTIQRQEYFYAHVANAFKSCTSPCKAVTVGGFVGSDLFNLWERAIKKAAAENPNVTVVTDQPSNFDPRTALRIVQDALGAHPDVTLVVSAWDDMTRGVEQAITSDGKKPGKDVHIYSIGGTIDAVAKVKAGTYDETTVLLPYEEGYYGAIALLMAIEGKAINAYVDEGDMLDPATGPGSIFITKTNADKIKPNY